MIAQGLLLLLLVANSKALWDPNFGIRSLSHSRARGFECTEPGSFCESCTSNVFCTGDGASPLTFACETGQVCGGPGGCIASASAVECNCDTIDNSGFLVDPYDPSNYIFCIPPSNQFFLSCADGEIFSTEENTCITEPTPTPSTDTEVTQVDSSTDSCSTDGIGLHTNDPTCLTYTACYSTTLPGLLLSCADGQVFDASQLKCVAECDLAPTSFACPAGSMGALPDTSDCTIFHVCSNGVAVTPATGVPCPDGEAFEPTSMTCTSSDVVCPETKQCWDVYCDACGGPCPVAPLISDTADTTTALTTTASTTTTPTTTEPITTIPTTKTPTTTTPTTTPLTTTPPITTPPTTTPPTTTPPPTTPTTTPTTTTPPTTTPPTTTTPTTTPPITTPPTTTPPTTTPPTTTPPITTPPTTTPPTTKTPTTPKTRTTAPTTTTATSTTTAAAGPPNCNTLSTDTAGYHEHPDCKQFYACQSNGSGGFETVLYRCPGSLVFIPSKNYCSLQSDLPAAPGCIAS